MRKLSILTILLSFVANIGIASALTPEQALKRMESSRFKARKSTTSDKLQLRYTLRTSSDKPSIYIFDKMNGNGYLLLSADDAAAPLLGYTDTGTFDINNMPPQLIWWLSEYGRQVEYASVNSDCLYASETPRNARKTIAPLLKTKWNQDAPYNAEVPSLNGRNYPTGCVATAMAQVMKYWNYPVRGTDSGSIALPSGATGDASMSFRIAYDWDNMLDTYIPGAYNDTQKAAVARLMKACGYSTKMSYGMGGSGTLSRFAAEALVKNFSYNASIQYCERNYYSATEWEEMIYQELESGRPVLYGGQSSSVGHEFVCDGYAGDGYFHFNWGWGGMSDGYFLLAALDPDAVGIGGGTGNDGYNSNQDIIIGIQPESDDSYVPRITQFGTLNPSLSGNIVTMALDYSGRQGFWVNTDFRAISVNFGVLVESVAQNISEAVTIATQTISAPKLEPTTQGYQVSYSGIQGSVSFNLPNNLPDGTYKVTVCSRPSDNGSTAWLPVLCEPTAKNCFFVTRSSSAWKLEEKPVSSLRIDNAAITGKLYYGCASVMSVTVSNTSASPVEIRLKPVLYSGEVPAMEGEMFVVSQNAGETKEMNLTTLFRLLPGQNAPSRIMSYRLGFIDADSGIGYDWSTSVRMMVGGTDSFKVTGLEISDGILTGETEGNSEVPNVYQIISDNTVTLKAEIQNTGVYFGYGIAAQIFAKSDLTVIISTATFRPVLILANNGDKGTIKGEFSTDGLEDGILYGIRLYAMTPNGFAEIKDAPEVCFRIATSGVEDLISETGLPIRFDKFSRTITAIGDVDSLEVFDTSGMKIANNMACNGEQLSCRIDNGRKGVFIIVAKSKPGKITILKIVI